MTEPRKIKNTYTACYWDAKNKVQKGIVFAAMLTAPDIKSSLIQGYSVDDTYMTMWLKCIAKVLRNIEKEESRASVHNADYLIHLWIANIQPLTKKWMSIVESLSTFTEEDAFRLLELKLKRKNYTAYETHDMQREIVQSMWRLRDKYKIKVSFRATSSNHPDMQTVYQHAALTLGEQNALA